MWVSIYSGSVIYQKPKSSMLPGLDVTTNASCTNCRRWMVVGYQVKGNIVCFLLWKYFPILRTVFPQSEFQYSPSHLKYQKSIMLTNLDVSTNARCIKRGGWKAAGYHVKDNIVFYLLTKYLSVLTSRVCQSDFDSILVIWRSVGKVAQEYILTSIFPRIPDARTAATKWLPTLIRKKLFAYISWKSTVCL